MRIVFDASTLHQSKLGSVTGVVHFDFGADRQFPESGWNDFVVVVATWWLDALEQIARGSAQADLRFMDGPYWITAVAQGPDLLLRCVENRTGAGMLYEVTVAVEDLKRELMIFARQLSSTCAKAKIQSPDLNELRKYLPH
jgi:hypothetical protein